MIRERVNLPNVMNFLHIFNNNFKYRVHKIKENVLANKSFYVWTHIANIWDFNFTARNILIGFGGGFLYSFRSLVMLKLYKLFAMYRAKVSKSTHSQQTSVISLIYKENMVESWQFNKLISIYWNLEPFFRVKSPVFGQFLRANNFAFSCRTWHACGFCWSIN